MLNHLRLTCLFTLGALALAAQTTTPPVPETRTTGMVGLAEGQTARLNLLNPGVLPPALGMICTASVTFFDAGGTALKTAALSIPPGQSASASLSGDTDLTLPAGERREIRAQISIPGLIPASGATTVAAPACKLVPTLEIYDTVSGHTLVTLGRMVEIPAVVASGN